MCHTFSTQQSIRYQLGTFYPVIQWKPFAVNGPGFQISVKSPERALVREPNSENCLDLIFSAPPCEKVITVADTNYITSAIRKFMLDMPGPGSFQNIGFLIWAIRGPEHVKPCGSNWVKIKGAQLKINLCSSIVHWMLIINGKRTMMIRCIFTELLECKVHEKCLCLLMSALFEDFELQYLCQEASGHHGSLSIFDRHSMHYRSVWADF